MTKSIHVINADEAGYKVNVIVQDKVFALNEDTGTWYTVEVLPLNHGGAICSRYITSSRRIIIEEAGAKSNG